MTTDAATRLAGVRVRHKVCQGTGFVAETVGRSGGDSNGQPVYYDCTGCNAGFVYLFPETVREQCDHRHYGMMATRSQHKCAECGDFTVTDIPIYVNSQGHGIRCRCQGRGWNASRDGWEEAAVAAGASVYRTWWNRDAKIWAAEVRMVATHRESSVAQGDSPDQARLSALTAAVDKIPGRVWPE